MLILFWLSQTLTVALRIQEKVFCGCTVPPDNKETKLWSSDQGATLSAGENTVVGLVPFCEWKCVPAAIFGSVDISKVPRCPLLQQMSSKWGLQKLVQEWVCLELSAYLSDTAYLSDFCLFAMQLNGHVIKRM